MTLLQNIFVKSIIVPIGLAIAAAFLGLAPALAKGRSRGQHRYRVWIRQRQPDNTTTVVPVLGQSIHAILNQQNEIVGIELMVRFDVGEFGSLGVDLIIGAYAVDITSLIGAQSNPTVIGYILVGHLFMLIAIVVFLIVNNLASPEEQKLKRRTAVAAIGIGLFAMVIAFLAA